jgi:hypothetical protein
MEFSQTDERMGFPVVGMGLGLLLQDIYRIANK